MKLFFLLVVFFFISVHHSPAQLTDSNKAARLIPDSLAVDSTHGQASQQPKTYQLILDELLKQNRFLTFSAKPVSFINKKKQAQGKEYLFYLLSSILLLFGFFKVFYARYFNNIFRVFFNTSLRQNQLTDLLLQARLPSLIFNIFFTIAAGLYLWLISEHYNLIEFNNKTYLWFCIIVVGLIYGAKFLILKFIGWVTGLVSAFDTYIFVIFLINKILGIILIPFIIILAFASAEWIASIIVLSLLIIGIFFLLRFFRSYSLLQHQLDINRFHFFLYIISVEILPLFVLFKLLINLSFLA